MVTFVLAFDKWAIIIVAQALVNCYFIWRLWTHKEAIFARVLVNFVKQNRQQLVGLGKAVLAEQLGKGGKQGEFSLEGLIGTFVGRMAQGAVQQGVEQGTNALWKT